MLWILTFINPILFFFRFVSRTSARSWSTGAWTTSTWSPAANTLTTGPGQTQPRDFYRIEEPDHALTWEKTFMLVWTSSPTQQLLSFSGLSIYLSPENPQLWIGNWDYNGHFLCADGCCPRLPLMSRRRITSETAASPRHRSSSGTCLRIRITPEQQRWAVDWFKILSTFKMICWSLSRIVTDNTNSIFLKLPCQRSQIFQF